MNQLEKITAVEWCRMTGDTLPAIHSRRRRGVWVDGTHCYLVQGGTRGGKLWVNVPAAQAWVESGGSLKK